MKTIKVALISLAAVFILGLGTAWAFNDMSAGPVERIDKGMSETQVQTAMHQMTHYKVEADRKWGKVKLTEQNVNNLIEIVEANNYEHEAWYLENLNDWKNGDFSNAVGVHNTIWSWHNGTVGQATGLMSDEEAKEYADKN